MAFEKIKKYFKQHKMLKKYWSLKYQVQQALLYGFMCAGWGN
jgi:hypothetical protein